MQGLDLIKKIKIVPVVKITDVNTTLPVMNALKNGGIPIAEITYRTECASEAISLAVKNCPDMLIGAGTVVNAEQARSAIASGAQFIVSPGFSSKVADVCQENNILYIPGAITPTEIMATMEYDLPIIKFFPAETFGGLASIKALSAPFPKHVFIPTGGINKANIKEYLSFSKIIACGGSWMVKDSLINNGEYDKIEEISREAIKEINE